MFQLNTVQFEAIQLNTVHFKAIQLITVQFITVLSICKAGLCPPPGVAQYPRLFTYSSINNVFDYSERIDEQVVVIVVFNLKIIKNLSNISLISLISLHRPLVQFSLTGVHPYCSSSPNLFRPSSTHSNLKDSPGTM